MTTVVHIFEINNKCHCMAHNVLPGVRAHNITAPKTPLVASSRVHSVPIMCDGLQQGTRHSTSLPCWQSPADRRRPSTSSPALDRRCKYRPYDALPSATERFQWQQPMPKLVYTCKENGQLTDCTAVLVRDK